MKKTLIAVLALPCALYFAAMGWLWFHQEKLLFQPTTLPANFAISPAPDVKEVTVPVPGAQLSVLHLKAASSKGAKGVVFFLHGNGGNIDTWFPDPDFYRSHQMDVVMMDYRGYGKSTGQIESEAQLRADVRAVWQHFAPQYAGKKKMVLGRSLGTALAAGLSVELAQQGQPVDATILISAYESMEKLALAHYPLVPSAVLRYPLRTYESVAALRSPLLLIHGQADSLIKPSHSQVLQKLAPQSRLVLVPKAGHNDLQEFEPYLQAIRDEMARL
jgi:uncharacterized protein